MAVFNCPSCGGAVKFQSGISVYSVCPYCSTMVVRTDVDVESIGVMAQLPDDMSPIQVGTQGYYGKLHFGVIGRMKVSWPAGTWNEWFIVFDDASYGWLAEAQGAFAVCRLYEQPLPSELVAWVHRWTKVSDREETGYRTPREREELEQTLKPGFEFKLDKSTWIITDIKTATCVGSEGELPGVAPIGKEIRSIDLMGANFGFGTLEVSDGNVKLFIGRYLEWDELRISYARELEGWT
jgi:hypothetical protein